MYVILHVHVYAKCFCLPMHAPMVMTLSLYLYLSQRGFPESSTLHSCFQWENTNDRSFRRHYVTT